MSPAAVGLNITAFVRLKLASHSTAVVEALEAQLRDMHPDAFAVLLKHFQPAASASPATGSHLAPQAPAPAEAVITLRAGSPYA